MGERGEKIARPPRPRLRRGDSRAGAWIAFSSLAILAVVGGCESSGFRIAEEGYELPATVDEMLPIADDLATRWDDAAFLWGMGGGYTVTDAEGRGFNHSFLYYSPVLQQILELNLFAGANWSETTPRPRADAPAPLRGILEFANRLTSPEAIDLAVRAAEDSSPPPFDDPEVLSVRLRSHPVWPERSSVGQVTDSLAYRVDFLQERVEGGTTRWWSLVRVYVHPITGEVFEVIDDDVQIYPNL